MSSASAGSSGIISRDYTVNVVRKNTVFRVTEEDMSMWKSTLLEFNGMDDILYNTSIGEHGMEITLEVGQLLFEYMAYNDRNVMEVLSGTALRLDFRPFRVASEGDEECWLSICGSDGKRVSNLVRSPVI